MPFRPRERTPSSKSDKVDYETSVNALMTVSFHTMSRLAIPPRPTSPTTMAERHPDPIRELTVTPVVGDSESGSDSDILPSSDTSRRHYRFQFSRE